MFWSVGGKYSVFYKATSVNLVNDNEERTVLSMHTHTHTLTA